VLSAGTSSKSTALLILNVKKRSVAVGSFAAAAQFARTSGLRNFLPVEHQLKACSSTQKSPSFAPEVQNCTSLGNLAENYCIIKYKLSFGQLLNSLLEIKDNIGLIFVALSAAKTVMLRVLHACTASTSATWLNQCRCHLL